MQWQNPNGSLTKGVVIEDGAGNKLGTSANPLNVTGGGGSGSNASVGATGAAVPASATALGYQNAAGNLILPTPAAGLPVADSGAAITGASMPAGGAGLSGWLSAIWTKLTGTLSVSAASLPLPAGAAQEAGGNLAAILTKLGAVVLSSGSAIIGKFGIDQTTPGTTNGVVVNAPLPAGSNTIGGVTTPVSAPLAGQKAIATTNTALALGSGALANGVIVKAASTNAANIWIGPSGGVTRTNDGTGNGYALAPGEAISYAAANLSQVYINGTAADFVYFAGN